MRDVAIASFAQAPLQPGVEQTETQMLYPVILDAIAQSGLQRDDIGFTCSGSADYLTGMPFAFVANLEAAGAWPPISESHVEMDGAWALYEAWVRLQHGDVDAALVFSSGVTCGDLREVLSIQLDPYYLAPLWPDYVSLAALQANAYLDASGRTEADMAEVVSRSLRDAKTNSNAHRQGDRSAAELLDAPAAVGPLREHDWGPECDGAAAVVLVAGDPARALDEPVWIRGIDHRSEAHYPGMRDLTTSASTRLAAERSGALQGPVDVAELHAPFSHQELLLRDTLDLDDGATVNPSGGALCGNAFMVSGLLRIGEAYRRLAEGDGRRALAHATSGPCLQQNLVCLLEAN